MLLGFSEKKGIKSYFGISTKVKPRRIPDSYYATDEKNSQEKFD